MGIAAVSGLFIPDVWYAAQGPSQVANLLDASGEKFASVLQASKTGSIRKIGLDFGTVTTATDTQVRIETVDLATGFPSGTLWATDTEVTVLAAAITTGVWVMTGALTADAVVTKGDFFAVVVAPSGTPNYNVTAPYITQQTQGFPYNAHYAAGAWGMLLTNVGFAIEYSDGTYAYIPGSYPVQTITATNFNNTPNLVEVGLKFRLPFAFSMAGIWAHAIFAGDCEIVLYDSNGTSVLRTLAVDKDVKSSALPRAPSFLAFSESYVGLANTFYRVVVKPTSATNVTLYTMLYDTNAIMGQLSGGSDFIYNHRVDAGAWAESASKWRTSIGVWLDGVAVEGSGQRGSGQLAGPILVS